jgi:hypothetical protein
LDQLKLGPFRFPLRHLCVSPILQNDQVDQIGV